MTYEIKPALSPEEWAARKTELMKWGERSIEHFDGDEWCYINPDRHALAAIALYGTPEGFTWEHVDRLRKAAHTAREVHDSDGGWQDELAGLIEALLPPRKPA